MRALLALGLAFALALLPAIPALSLSESGSHGWSRTELVLRNGPGSNYQVTGQVPGEVAIKILRCQKVWCLVDGPGGRGWTGLQNVDFGKDPYGPLDARDHRPDIAGGSMCFYEGTNYTGRSFCAGTGQVYQDLATFGWDNRVNSIQVVNPTSAAICRDRFFQSYCVRVYESQPVLDSLLQRNISSIRVY